MIQVKRNFWIVLALLLTSVAAAAIWGSAIYYRLSYLWGLIIITGYIWTYVSLRGVTITRQARTLRQQVGQIFEERFEVANTSRLPRLWIVLQDKSSLPGNTGSRVLTLLGGLHQRTYLSYTWLTRRGQFLLGPTVLESGDLFGLFTARTEIPGTSSLLITPFMVDLQAFPEPPGLLPGGRALQRKSLEVTPFAAGVREYEVGDSLNRIHWPSTAKRERLMVKEFDQDPQADVWIIIDAQKSIQAALPEVVTELKGDRLWLWRNRPDEVTLPPETIEYAVTIAASISQFYIKKGRAVGLASAGQTYLVLQAERGERQRAKIDDMLAFLQPEGDLPLVGITSSLASHLPRGSTVVLITPAVQKSVVLTAGDLLQRNLHPVVILLDAKSFGGPISPSKIAAELTELNIPVIQIANGDDIKQALEQHSISLREGSHWWSESNQGPAAEPAADNDGDNEHDRIDVPDR